MWELDPRFHTPGWAERRLRELDLPSKPEQTAQEQFEQWLRELGLDIDRLNQNRAMHGLPPLGQDANTTEEHRSKLRRVLSELKADGIDLDAIVNTPPLLGKE